MILGRLGFISLGILGIRLVVAYRGWCWSSALCSGLVRRHGSDGSSLEGWRDGGDYRKEVENRLLRSIYKAVSFSLFGRDSYSFTLKANSRHLANRRKKSEYFYCHLQIQSLQSNPCFNKACLLSTFCFSVLLLGFSFLFAAGI